MPRTAGDPVILTGMHRSGTTLLTECLSRFGLFVGDDLEANSESRFFIRLNRWVLRSCHAGWEEPGPVRYVLEDERLRRFAADYLRLSVASPRVRSYLGLRRWAAAERGTWPQPWGWKDPVNTVTLPLWLDVFPGARVVYVERHGVDVASSLRVRHGRHMDRVERDFRRRRLLHLVRTQKQGFSTARVATLDGGLTLWAEYLDWAEENLARTPNAYRLSYEALVAEPTRVLRDVAAFLDLPVTDSQVQGAAQLVRVPGGTAGKTVTAHPTDEIDLTDDQRALLARHGYGTGSSPVRP